MKRRFTILTAALALLTFLAVPMGMWGQASVGTTLWSEDFSGYSNNTVPSGSITNSHTGTTVYGGVTLTYACTNGGSTTQTYTSGGPNSNSNLLISKNGGSFTISGISTGEASELTVTYAKSGSGNVTISSSTEGVTIGGSTSGSTITTGGASTISITFTNSTSSNLRFDDAEITVKTAGGGQQLTTSDLALVDAPVELEFDLYDNANAQTVSYTTSSTGAVTVSQSNYITATVNANNTITVTPVAVTNGPQTITVNQAADNTYAAGSVTFTVDIEDSTPTTGSDVTFDATEDKDLNNTTQGEGSIVKNGVTFTCSDGILGNGTEYRLYKNSTTTFSVESGTITQIVFTCPSGNPASGFGTQTGWTTNGNNGTWTGSATSVSFVASSKQVRATTIVVTVETSGTPDPTISADDVNIAYSATSGSITYTINNEPSPAGTLTAAVTDGNWLTLGQGTTSPIAFTCSANENTTARTATVTLTYTYNNDQTVTANVTVTQAAAPVIYSTIPALFAAATSTETNVLVTFNNWVVSGVSTNGKNVFVTDNNGNGFVIFDNNGGLENTYTAGNILAGTAVPCSLKKYNGFAELVNVDANDLTITTGGTVSTSNIAMADLVGVNTGALLHYDNLTCSVDASGNTPKYYLSDGTTTLQVYNALYAFNALEDGETYNITGIYQQYNNTKEILPRSAEDIEEVEVQHEEYTLTVSNLSHVNLFIFGGEDSETIISTEDGETTAQVYDGTEVLVSIDVEAGYVFQSLTITDGNGDAVEMEELTPDEYYSFTMPTSNVTISATAVEYVAPVSGNYVRITSLDQLTEGSKVIIAARYNESVTNGYYAMKTTLASGKAAGVNFTSTTSDGNEILPTSIVNEEDDYYWIVNETENGYTFTNVNDAKISYNSSTNFNMNGSSADWTIESGTAGNSAMVAGYTGFVIKNYATNSRAFAFNGSVFGPYAWTNNNAAGYNFFLDFFVQTEAVEFETYELNIDGYTDVTEGTNNKGYYLIASPVTVDPATVEGMTEDDFDLYYFDQSEEDEWINYETANGVNPSFGNLVPGKGYLYAKKATNENSTYSFELTGTPYSGNGEIGLDYDENAEFPGFNLIGNPFGNTANLSLPYYRLNQDGSALNTSTEFSEVNVMEGVFVQATAATRTATFAPSNTGFKRISQLNVKVTRNRGAVLDNAIIRFDDGATLGKFQLNPNDTKIYITEGNQDYAIVRSANAGEMPVSFKAAENGNYTLSIETENVEVSYLHLIDNMTGADVDLLATPSYSFDARTTDNANRFRLMFNTNGVDENTTTANFAYFNGSSWTISNMGEATLQVVDMMGRVISTQAISGNTDVNLNQAAGVYMLRLVNGENAMVQKVVVR